MEISWSTIKEIFFVVGSIAGVAALLRPVFEAKFDKDQSRIEHVLDLIDEQALVDLEAQVELARRVPDTQFQPFEQLAHELRTNQEIVRFTGPLSSHLNRELSDLIDAYQKLRGYIQVNEWLPHHHKLDDGSEKTYWQFNREAFARETGYATGYADHLRNAADQALRMRSAFQRFQLVREVHIFESPVAGWLLKRRFRRHGLKK